MSIQTVGEDGMGRIVVTSRVGVDGVLQLNVPVGAADAGREVHVTVEPVAAAPSADEWRRQVFETAGKWQGPLDRPGQDDYERREPLA
jgi:hypothetical protein